ncbi:MAG TPA: prolyl oligopeptidase family serine peptidase [Steroidobacteraceae bacterium]|nr:prolyl oligopeptidase family serine peptidase [Steroidobacteraceae bacterium]
MADTVSARRDTRGLIRIVRTMAVVAAACVTASTPGAEGRPSVEDFFRSPMVVNAKLSPDGSYLAVTGTGPNGRVALMVADLSKPLQLRGLANFDKADVRRFFWVNNRRLVYDAQDLQSWRETGNGGLFAIDLDGSHFVRLIAAQFDFHQENTGSIIKSRILPTTYVFHSTLPGDTDDVVVAEYAFLQSDPYNEDHVRLVRLNTRTQEQRDLLDNQPPWVHWWLLDGDGHPRIAVSTHKNIWRVHYREKGSPAWKVLDEKDALDPAAIGPSFIGFDDLLYAWKAGEIYVTDLKQAVLDWKPFLTLKGFDFDGDWEADRKARKLLGVHFLTDAYGTHWIDPRMAEAQKAIDAALPGTTNTITCGNCLSSKFFLVHAASDRQPTRFLLFDPAANKFMGYALARPWIDAKQMGQRDFFRFRARDGMEIPVYVTLPPQWKKGERVPLIVLVHGGPWVRGASWEWDPEAQFLATRGYAVVQPEFRGGTGFGYEHFHAGWHQWGRAMQDDLADAARWAIAQGYADPARIAIGGASYGGYATLMGLIKEPELFRCGFEFAGVTDIELMYSITWSDASDEAKKYGYPTLIGDPEKDAAQIAETSPLKNAQRLKQPLLMAHGVDDVRVPIKHGRKFHDAVTDTNKNVEWIVYSDEGHGFHQDEHRIDYWKHVEAFLHRCLGSSPGQLSDNRPDTAPPGANSASPTQ